MRQTLHTLKQAAIEVAQWNEKRPAEGNVSIHVIRERLPASRDRLAAANQAGTEEQRFSQLKT
jgi:hypothetical protein